MENSYYISHFCSIEHNTVKRDGAILFESEATNFQDFSKETLRHLEVSYPKFFKMDALSKLAFLGAELLLGDENQDKDQTALLLSNASSSLDTDVDYQKSIADKDNYFPSPAVFVYTLPNICLGEISIRHQLKTENSFFIFDAFNPGFMWDYAEIMMASGKAKQVLCGWVDYFGESYKAFMYLVSEQGDRPHTKENIALLYKN